MQLVVSAPQISRVKSLLARLAALEESVASLTTPPAVVVAAAASSRAEQAYHRAKALEARITRLELEHAASGENTETSSALQDLVQVSRRVEFLEHGVLRITGANTTKSENVRRVISALQGMDFSNYELLRVPDGRAYYEQYTLEDRARLLQVGNTDALCKTLLYSATGDEEDLSSLFLLVVNYSFRISPSKFKAEIKRHFASNKTPKQVSSEVMNRILGFPENGVSVVGGKHALPIVIASSVLSSGNNGTGNNEIVLGGGELDVKLKIGDLASFVAKSGAIVLDVTDKRVGGEEVDEAPTAAATNKAPATPAASATSKAPASPQASKKRALEEEGSGGEESTTYTFDDLDIRVGLVTKCWKHPDSAKLLCEEIDLGESSGPRQIASGLQAHYSPEEFQGKRVCVVANLKPAKLAGFASNGMVLCAVMADGDKVRLVEAPADAALGARLVFEAKKDPAAAPAAIKKKKILEKVLPALCLDADGVYVEYAGKRITVEGSTMAYCKVDGGQGEPRAKVS